MGLNTNSLRVLATWVGEGNTLGRVLMLGELQLTMGRYETLESFVRVLEPLNPGVSADELKDGRGALQLLGATSVTSLDMSTFAGASIAHDLNHPLPDKYRRSFDTVIDGGTLEHVFNFPVAIKSAMELLVEGGNLFVFTPLNNQPGHGFYQFTPELFFRVLSPENGFEICSMVAYERFTGSMHYQITDPKVLGRRLALVNNHPTDMAIVASRRKVVSTFESSPQQSDYSIRWEADNEEPRAIPRASRKLRVVQALVRHAEAKAPEAHQVLQSWIDRFRRGRSSTMNAQPETFRRL